MKGPARISALCGRLDVYVLMVVIRLETLNFCRRFLDCRADDPCGRQFDRMTQAARAGVKNLAESHVREVMSVQGVLKLLEDAKASLCELRNDYLVWLLDRGGGPWPIESDEAKSVSAVRVATVLNERGANQSVVRRIDETRKLFAPWFGQVSGPALPSPDLIGRPEGGRPISSTELLREARQDLGVRFANAMIILIDRASRRIGRLMRQCVPPCPACGARLRFRRGAQGCFWVCSTCSFHGAVDLVGKKELQEISNSDLG